MPSSSASSTREHAEIREGVKAGEQVIVHGQAGLPDGASITTEKPEADRSDSRSEKAGDRASKAGGQKMNVAATALRHSRAAALVAAALVVAGGIAAFSLPSRSIHRSSFRAS